MRRENEIGAGSDSENVPKAGLDVDERVETILLSQRGGRIVSA